jgi:hypothetical protein
MMGKHPLQIARQHGHSTMLRVYTASPAEAIESNVAAIPAPRTGMPDLRRRAHAINELSNSLRTMRQNGARANY